MQIKNQFAMTLYTKHLAHKTLKALREHKFDHHIRVVELINQPSRNSMQHVRSDEFVVTQAETLSLVGFGSLTHPKTMLDNYDVSQSVTHIQSSSQELLIKQN